MMRAALGFAASLAAAFSMAANAGETILDVDFSQQLPERHLKQKGSFDGPLPNGMQADFPGWTSSVVKAEKVSENGKSFLRLKVEKLDPAVQFNWPLQELKTPGHYRLSTTCRLSSSDLGFGVRQLPAPYTTFWETSISYLKEGWQERSFDIDMTADNKIPLGLFLYPGLGNLDLASLKLEKISIEERVASQKRPEKGCQNFFRNSRFPLGLQAGWSLAREFSGGSVEADPANPGPSGQPSLKMQSEKALCVFSEPFQTSDPYKRNFVSFSYKSSGKWTASVVHTAHWMTAGSKTLEPSSEWKTAVMELKLDDKGKTAKAFALKFNGEGTLNIDSLQAWAGEPARPFKPQGECEVALALPKGEASDSRIQFSSEKPEIDWVASGDIDGAVLKMKAFDLYGDEKALSEISLGRSFFDRLAGEAKPVCEKGSARYDVFPGKELGQIRVEAWIERDGKRVSPFNEILVTRIQKPVHFNEDAPNSPFGSHFMASPLTIATMKAAGVNWARFHDASTDLIGWYHLEPEKGKWIFHDEEIKLYRDKHISIFAGLQTAPLWASAYKSSGKKDVNGYFDRYFEPVDMDAWKNYVKTTTSRYKGVIDEYFIWNEPWGDSFWHASYDAATGSYKHSQTPELDYAKLSVATFQAAKEGNPSSKIAGFNSFGGAKGAAWTKGVYEGGAYPACDLIDYHFYTPKDQACPGDQAQAEYDSAVGVLKDFEKAPLKDAYMSEGQGNATGGSGSAGPGFYKRAITWDDDNAPAVAGDKTCRFVVANLAAGAKKVFLYSAHCYIALALPSNFGTLVGPDGYPHAELAAFSQLAQELEDSSFVKRIDLSDKVFAYVFKKKDGSSVAAVSGNRLSSVTLPKNGSFKTFDLFGNKSDGVYKGLMLYAVSEKSPEELEKALLAK